MANEDPAPNSRQMSLLDILDRPPIEALYSPDQIYESEDFQLFSRLTEDPRFDRKSASAQPKELAKYLSAFGNGPSVDGGVLAIGIDNDGTVSGCKRIEQDRLSEIESCGIKNCPDGRFISKRVHATNKNGEDDFIILIRINYVDGKLITLSNGDAYERMGDECRRLDEEKSKKSELIKANVRLNKSLVI
jgi:ATP-dependent DNA helicase RecG